MSSSYTSLLNSFSQFFEYVLFVVDGWMDPLQAFLEGGSAISESKSEPLYRFLYGY